MPLLSPHRVVFAGCARDALPHLPAVWANIEATGRLFADQAAVFIENDSTDGTGDWLSQATQDMAHARLIRLDGLGARAPARTVRLAMARNAVLSVLRQWADIQGFDTLVLLDLDDVNTRPWSPEAIARAVHSLHAQPDTVGLFANQLGQYYDLWALREPQRCPGDVWEAAFDAAMQEGLSDDAALAREVLARRFVIGPDAAPVPVASAFGGLGIYKLDAVRRAPLPYCGETTKVWGRAAPWRVNRWQVCEHVNFHLGLGMSGGRLFIQPDLINADYSDLAPPPADTFRRMVF
jgi:hypothetical protein